MSKELNHYAAVEMSLNDKIYQIIKKRKEVSTKEIQTILNGQGIDRSLRTIQRHLSDLYDDGRIKHSHNRKTKEIKYSINMKRKNEDYALEGLGELF